jgi:hypothetical protein
MDAQRAVEFAFTAGLKVRGKPAAQTARVSLAIHATRTPDGRPILACDAALASRAIPALVDEKRLDHALRVALWADDADAAPTAQLPQALVNALSAYRQAKAWGQGRGGPENLLWIREVPRDFALRSAIGHRLLLRAKADPALRSGLASACVEAELAELPRVAAFSTIFRAATLAGDPKVIARTLAGLGVLDPADDTPQGRDHFATLRSALVLARLEAEGRPIEEAAAVVGELLHGDAFASGGLLALHLAATLHRQGRTQAAVELLAATRAEAQTQKVAPRSVLAGLSFVEQATAVGGARGPPPVVADLRAWPVHLAAGATQACAALADPAPALAALQVLDPDSVGIVIPWRDRASLVRDLVGAGAWAAAEAKSLEALRAIADRVRRMGLAVGWEIFLRAMVADEAARLAAMAGNDDAWNFAVDLARRGPGAFERAKMSGRIALDFVRAAQLPPLPQPWVDPHFPAAPAPEPR